MNEIIGLIGKNTVTVTLGDMTRAVKDAYIVPEFNSAASYGGVGGAVARAGAKGGLDSYQDYVDENGKLPFAQVVLTPSFGGNSEHLLHVVSVASGRENEFETVKTSIFNALNVAQANGIGSIAIPALGTGIIGDLTDEQSAKAMMAGIYEYAQAGGKPLDISFILFAGPKALDDFGKVLQSGSYKDIKSEAGSRDFNMVRWMVEMNGDANANDEAGQKGKIAITRPVKGMQQITTSRRRKPGSQI